MAASGGATIPYVVGARRGTTRHSRGRASTGEVEDGGTRAFPSRAGRAGHPESTSTKTSARARAEEERARRRATRDGVTTMRRCAAKDGDSGTRIGVDTVAAEATNKIREDLAEEEEGDGLYRQSL